MSIKVELDELRAVAAGQAPFAYLLTVSDDAAPHLVAITPAIGDGEITCEAGQDAAARTRPRGRTSRCSGRPPTRPTTRSSSTATRPSTGRSSASHPRRAVRHRPAPGGGNDCAPVSILAASDELPSS